MNYMLEGEVYAGNHDFRRALDSARRGQRILHESNVGSLYLAGTDIALGSILLESGATTDSIALVEPAVRTIERQNRALPILQQGLVVLGRAYVRRHRSSEGIALLERALAIAEQARHVPNLADAKLELAQALWADSRQRERARKLAQSAQRMFSDIPIPAREREAREWLVAHGPS
jgi:tetratricopeptide (TPR) repeat protein